MQENQVKILYKERILPESINPFHFEKTGNFTHEIAAYNPLCGDKFTLLLNIKDHIITDTSFSGFGCALSKASTSILLKNIQDKTVLEAMHLLKSFFKALEEETKPADSDVSFLVQLRDFGGRKDCITLSWEAIQKNLTT